MVTDASGTFNEVTRHAAWARMAEAGVQMMSWFGVACELHRDWRLKDPLIFCDLGPFLSLAKPIMRIMLCVL